MLEFLISALLKTYIERNCPDSDDEEELEQEGQVEAFLHGENKEKNYFGEIIEQHESEEASPDLRGKKEAFFPSQ